MTRGIYAMVVGHQGNDMGTVAIAPRKYLGCLLYGISPVLWDQCHKNIIGQLVTRNGYQLQYNVMITALDWFPLEISLAFFPLEQLCLAI